MTDRRTLFTKLIVLMEAEEAEQKMTTICQFNADNADLAVYEFNKRYPNANWKVWELFLPPLEPIIDVQARGYLFQLVQCVLRIIACIMSGKLHSSFTSYDRVRPILLEIVQMNRGAFPSHIHLYVDEVIDKLVAVATRALLGARNSTQTGLGTHTRRGNVIRPRSCLKDHIYHIYKWMDLKMRHMIHTDCNQILHVYELNFTQLANLALNSHRALARLYNTRQTCSHAGLLCQCPANRGDCVHRISNDEVERIPVTLYMKGSHQVVLDRQGRGIAHSDPECVMDVVAHSQNTVCKHELPPLIRNRSKCFFDYYISNAVQVLRERIAYHRSRVVDDPTFISTPARQEQVLVFETLYGNTEDGLRADIERDFRACVADNRENMDGRCQNCSIKLDYEDPIVTSQNAAHVSVIVCSYILNR